MKILTHSTKRKLRRYLPVALKKRLADPIYKSILEHFESHPDEGISYGQELQFLREDGLAAIPYFWTRSYEALKVDVNFDTHFHLPFVMHRGKKLFFPRQRSIDAIANAYRALLIEQDDRSPHCYHSIRTQAKQYDSLIDVGAAEGILALEMIDDLSKVVLCECSPEWVDALEATFAPYKDKVLIVKKAASSVDSASTVSLQTLTAGISAENTLIKIDVEGCEKDVVEGLCWQGGSGVSIICCTYHRADDAEYFKTKFSELRFTTEFSDGYMLLLVKDVDAIKPPYFRKGIIRAF